MTRIVEYLSVAELGRRYRAAQDVTEARHTQAIWLRPTGMSEAMVDTPRVVERASRHRRAKAWSPRQTRSAGT